MDAEWDEHTKQDWYFAQIAAVIERLFMEDPSKLPVEDKLIKFGMKDKMPKKDEDEIEDDTPPPVFDVDKQFWLARLGITLEEDPK